MDTDTHAPDTDAQSQYLNVLDTVDGEIHFFRALMRTRPVGVNRYFHMISMQAAIEKGTKHSVPIEDIWRKLESCYNLDALETLEAEYELNANPSSSSTPQPTPSPKAGQNLATHPFFRSEFALPTDSYIDELVATRRVRATPSPLSSPARSPPVVRVPARRGRKRKASKADLAGLVSGDSDSSDLTQQSGDEAALTPSDRRGASVATGTDGGTEDMQEDEEDKAEDASTPKPRRGGRRPSRGRGSGRGLARKRKR
ncbi:hypothetical protein M0805_005826 [Coniferiporia weirii]|nr:hypothetical protein M0805_005826 [Coniferiporia weirii]